MPTMPTLPLRRLAAAVLALTSAALPAVAAPLQLTSGDVFNSFGASVSDDGSKVAFYSASNLTGANADNSFEIFLYDRYTDSLRQVSHFAGGHLAGGNQVPTISGDGQRIAYQHFDSNPTTAFFSSVYFDVATGTTHTITAPANAGETNELSSDGKTIAVATGNLGLRLYDIASGSFGSVLAGNTFSTALSRDGRVMAVEGFGNLSLMDRDAGTTVTVAPPGSGFNLRPDLSDDGRTLAFTSTFDPLGTNADRNSELFVYDATTGATRQVTHTTAGSIDSASISADGGRIAFTGSADLLGENADGNQEVYFVDLLDGQFTQVTHTAGAGLFSVQPSLSGDGLWLAFGSSGDLGGENPRHTPQIYLQALAPRGAEVPEPSTLLLLAAAALAALPGRRRLARAAGAG